jgi:cbb3-type cytochrome oxidase subunit 3
MEYVALIKQSVLVLFFTIFTGVLIYAWRMPKAEVEALSNIPLNSDERPLEGDPVAFLHKKRGAQNG